MLDWKRNLDKHIEYSMDNSFDIWCDQVMKHHSEEFYNENVFWLTEYDGLCNKWLNKLFKKKSPKKASEIIERAYRVFKQ